MSSTCKSDLALVAVLDGFVGGFGEERGFLVIVISFINLFILNVSVPLGLNSKIEMKR